MSPELHAKAKGVADVAVRAFLSVAQHLKPEDFTPLLIGGVLANVIGNVPMDYFERMVAVQPCGVVGCDCHLGIQASGAKFLRELRADWEENKVQKTAEA